MKKQGRKSATQEAGAKRPFRLIVHIGAGKTGTSSIQQTLKLSRMELRKAATIYWGLLLDQAPVKIYPWQKAGSMDQFHQLEQAEGVRQIADALTSNIADAAREGFEQAIWSNETLLSRHRSALPALKQVRDRGVDVKIVAYVRRHDAWARSSYIQWGLKHKTLTGPLPRFGQYYNRKPANFSGALEDWLEAFGDDVTIRNFDAAGDVVEDFLPIVGVEPESLTIQRRNEAPSPEELVLRAVFNEQFEGKVRPTAFDRTFGIDILRFDRQLDDWLAEMLPSAGDLQVVVSDSKQDRAILDRWFETTGQPPVDTSPLSAKPMKVDQAKLLATVCQIILKQASRINELERRIESLEPPQAKHREREKVSKPAGAAARKKHGHDE